MPGLLFDVEAARQSGASDNQILEYLRQRSPQFDVDAAFQAGHSQAEIIGYLAKTASPVTATGEPSEGPRSLTGDLAAAGHFGSNVLQGVGEGALQTVHGTGELIRKGANYVRPGLGNRIIPVEGQEVLQQIATPENTAQKIGKTAEDIAEFFVGDAALKGLSLGEKALKAAGLAERYEKASPFVQKTIAHVIDAGRQGVVAGGETGVKTGGDVGEAATVGAGVAAGSLALSGAAAAAGKVTKTIRAAFQALDTPEAVQTTLQGGIREALSKTAAEAGVGAPKAASMQSAIGELADNFRAKAKPVFEKLDELSGGELSNAQAAAKKYRTAVDKAGKDAYEEAMQKQDALFERFKDELGDSLKQAKADWKRYRALDKLQDEITKSVSGQRPEIAAQSAVEQPPETVKPGALLTRLNRLYNKGTLQTALGEDNASLLLDYVGAADARSSHLAQVIQEKRTAKNRIKMALGGLAGSGAATGLMKYHAIKNALAGK